MVVDASFALRLLVPSVDTAAAHEHWRQWHQECRTLLAPTYWAVEVASGLRRLEAHDQLTGLETERALAGCFELGVDLLPVDAALARSALDWSRRLGQAKAYDAFYLAVAELAGADLWTADLRLVRGARQAGITWVHGLGE
ncbi:MAG: type II toxin-antitoxin system VapC family toxin [Thermoanaerobaculia bacterium]|nr:type II toxin-antitoxin system VapC family toxin [Thermoanaerobaculia bacterium]